MSVADSEALDLISLGTVSYLEGWEIQKYWHRRVVKEERNAVLIMLEHRAVITLGKHSDPAFVLKAPEELEALGIELVHSERGGEATIHMPGQLVVYPILPLSRMRLAPKAYVENLLEAVILTLQDFGIDAYSDKLHPGVWVGLAKICAVGVRVSERVSLHGLALNISNSLDLFQTIVPCGIRERSVCSMETLLKTSINRAHVEERFLQHFLEIFGPRGLGK